MKTPRRLSTSLLSLLLVAAMLIPMSVFSVSAADTDLSDHLIIHYDFEGESSAEALKDKAPQGVSDDLSLGKGAGLSDAFNVDNAFKFENGTVSYHFPNPAKVNLQTGSALNSADLKALQEGAGTWFLRFSLKDINVSMSQLFDLRTFGTSRPFYLWYQNKGLTAGLATASTPNSQVSLFENNYPVLRGETVFDANDQWMNIAIVRTAEANGTYNITVYYCFGTPDGASSWFAYAAAKNMASRAPMTDGSTWGSRLCLFQSSALDSNLIAAQSVIYDDVRCYDTALTTEQLSSIFTEEGAKFAEEAPSHSRFYGYQLKAPYTNDNGEQVFDIRLLATIDSKDYASAGINFSTFERNIHWSDNAKGYEREVTHCFTSVLSNVDYKTEVTEAPDGSYFIAVTLTGIPVSVLNKEARSCMKFAVTTYVTDFDGVTSYSCSKFFTVMRTDLGV